MIADASKKLSPCNSCMRETEHDYKFISQNKVSPDGQKNQTNLYAVTCKGCCTVSLKQETQLEDFEIVIEYFPPRTWFRMPDWAHQLESLDRNIYDILKEVYSACHDKQTRLLAMGVRSVLDYVMVQIVGDVGGFETKLDKMVDENHLSLKQRKMLGTVIDAGSAAAHRGYKPPRPLLEEMVSIMEGVIREHYISEPMLQTLMKTIPSRPPRAKKNPSSAKESD